MAELLRVKERKIYELVSERAIPASRVTGKLLFPRDLVEAWVRSKVDYRESVESLARRPPIIAGSHDPLLEIALRESGSEIATFFDGSLDGLQRVANGLVIGAGMHVFEPDRGDFNRAHVLDRMRGMPVVMIEWAWRSQGLVLAPGNPLGISGIADLAGRRVIARQPSAGSYILLRHLLGEAGIEPGKVELPGPPARSEAEVAQSVRDGVADAGLAVESAALAHRLDFVPLFRERYDLLVWRHGYFEPAFQRLLSYCRGGAFRRRAKALGGYDVRGLGRVIVNL